MADNNPNPNSSPSLPKQEPAVPPPPPMAPSGSGDKPVGDTGTNITDSKTADKSKPADANAKPSENSKPPEAGVKDGDLPKTAATIKPADNLKTPEPDAKSTDKSKPADANAKSGSDATSALVESLIRSNTNQPTATAPLPTGTIIPGSTDQKPPPPKKKGKPKFVAAVVVVLLILITLPVIAYTISQRNQVTETRSRAAGEEVYPTATPTIDFWPSVCDNNPSKVLCRKDYPNICPGVSFPGYPDSAVGRYCSSSTCTGFDACAPTVVEGGSCAGLQQMSSGEPDHGIFVGCSGCLNCFCDTLSADGHVTCYTDRNSDSCAANVNCSNTIITNTPSTNISNTPTNTPRISNTPTETPRVSNTPTPTPEAACDSIHVFKADDEHTEITSLLADPNTVISDVIKPGDTLIISVVAPADSDMARVRVDRGQNTDELGWTEIDAKDSYGYYSVNWPIPDISGDTTFKIEAEIHQTGCTVGTCWK